TKFSWTIGLPLRWGRNAKLGFVPADDCRWNVFRAIAANDGFVGRNWVLEQRAQGRRWAVNGAFVF
ncbi:MAG: hypothetical protein AAFQ60_05115, partial [Pseudomonadota bacterium]